MKNPIIYKPVFFDMIIYSYRYLLTANYILIMIFCFSCKKDEKEKILPEIKLIFESGCSLNNDTVEVGKPLKFKVIVTAPDANITNFTIKKTYNGFNKTVLDSGLNSSGFTSSHTYYQSVEEIADWTFTIMDRDRNTASVSLKIFKDPNSQFGGIIEYDEIILGYQSNTTNGHFFLPSTGNVYFSDSAALYQELVDVLTYFNYREDNGVNLPSPTFSSPGEETSATGELYDTYYTFLPDWTTRNFTKYDIRVVNGVTDELFQNAHNDSMLIVSYDDVYGKKKYKWAVAGTFIPFQTAAGKRGIIKVLEADFAETGIIKFSMKIQI